MQTKRINTLVIVLSVLLVVCLGAVGIVSFAHTNAVKAAEASGEPFYVSTEHKAFMQLNATDTSTVNDNVNRGSYDDYAPIGNGEVVATERQVQVNLKLTENYKGRLYVDLFSHTAGSLSVKLFTNGYSAEITELVVNINQGSSTIFSIDVFGKGQANEAFYLGECKITGGGSITWGPSNWGITFHYLYYVELHQSYLSNSFGTNSTSSAYFNVYATCGFFNFNARFETETYATRFNVSCPVFRADGKVILNPYRMLNSAANDYRVDNTYTYTYEERLPTFEEYIKKYESADENVRLWLDEICYIDRYVIDRAIIVADGQKARFEDLSPALDSPNSFIEYVNSWQFDPNYNYDMTSKLWSAIFKSYDFNFYAGIQQDGKWTVGEFQDSYDNTVDFSNFVYNEGVSSWTNPYEGWYGNYTEKRMSIKVIAPDTKLQATADWSDYTAEYTGGSVGVTLPNVYVLGDDGMTKFGVPVRFTTPATYTEVDNYTVTIESKIAGISITNPTILVNITPAELLVEWSNTVVDYNGTAQAPVLKFKTPAGAIVDIPVEIPSYTNAGTYQINVEVPDQFEKNYTFSGGALSTEFKINKVKLNITWSDPTGGTAIEDNQWNRQFASTAEVNVTVPLPKVTGGIGSEVEIVFSTGDGTYTRPGTYNVSVEIKNKAIADNYIFEDTSKTLVIKVEGLQEVPVIWGELGEGVVTSTAVYTGSTLTYPTPTATLADSPLTLNVTITKSGVGVIDASQIIDAGTYYIDVTTDEEAILLYSQLTFTVTPAEVQLNWPENTFVYTGKPHTPVLPTATFNGDNVELRFVGGVVPTASLAGKTSFSVELVSSNFKFAESEKGVGTMTITPATIDVSNLSAIYNAAAHSSVVVDGLNGDQLTVNLTYSGALKNAGTYTVRVAFAQTYSNYQLASEVGTFTINPMALTVIWDDLEFDYTGEKVTIDLPLLTGLYGGDVAKLSFTTDNSFTAAGEYTVTVAIDNPNYTIANATKTVKIVEPQVDPTPEPTQPEGDNTALVVTLGVVGVGLIGALSYILVTVIKRRASK